MTKITATFLNIEDCRYVLLCVIAGNRSDASPADAAAGNRLMILDYSAAKFEPPVSWDFGSDAIAQLASRYR
jgi:hypothetical protein